MSHHGCNDELDEENRKRRLKELRAKAGEIRATSNRCFWSTPSIIAGIVLTTERRGRITLREVREIWGLQGKRIAVRLVGHSEDDLITTEHPNEHVLQEVRLDEPLILTRHGRVVWEALDELMDLATHLEAGTGRVS